jgi:hypothetical protein
MKEGGFDLPEVIREWGKNEMYVDGAVVILNNDLFPQAPPELIWDDIFEKWRLWVDFVGFRAEYAGDVKKNYWFSRLDKKVIEGEAYIVTGVWCVANKESGIALCADGGRYGLWRVVEG